MHSEQVGVGHARNVVADNAVSGCVLKVFTVTGRNSFRILHQKFEDSLYFFDSLIAIG
jgi:hypothetical protein